MKDYLFQIFLIMNTVIFKKIILFQRKSMFLPINLGATLVYIFFIYLKRNFYYKNNTFQKKYFFYNNFFL